MTENFYRSIIENIPVGYGHYRIIYDEKDRVKDYEFVDINKMFQEIIGIEKKEIIGRTVMDVLNERKDLHGRCCWINFYNSIENHDEDVETEHHFEILDEYYRIKIHYPDQNNMIIFSRDITNEIKQKEDYDLFADNTKLQIWHLQDPSTYGSANKAHANFLGLDKEDLEFQKLTSFYTPEEAALCIEGNQKVFKEKKKVIAEEWIVNSKGERRLVKVMKNPKFNQLGEVEFISCSAEDITEEYELQQKKEIKESILYAMIHFTEELLTNDYHYVALSNSIEVLGHAAQVDRVYYWENHYDEEKKEWFTSQKFEWCLDGVTEQIDNPELQNNSFEEVGDFVGVLAENRPFITHIKDMEESFTKNILASQGILSILVLPVFTNGNFKGFIGFDSCRFERHWTNVEMSLLNSFVLLYEKAVEKSFMEQHLVQVKDNFDNFFNMIDDFLLVFDQEGILINVNDTVLRKLDYSREELIGQSASKIHPEEKVEDAVNRMMKIKSGEMSQFSAMTLAKDGTTIPIETRISKGIWDGEDVFFAVSKDISKLTKSEEKFSTAFNLSGTSMIISTIEDGEFFEVNDAFLDIVGYERDEIIGKKIEDQNIFRTLIEEEDTREKITKEIEKNQRIYNYEVEMVSKDNKITTGLCNIVSVIINNKTYFLTSIVDITESKLLTQELAKAKKESDIANEAKSQFLSHISHEIRTPMNAVIGYSNLLGSTILTQKQERYIEGVKASTEMLMSIINDILDWSKIDNNGMELENRKFNIDDVINNVVEQQMFKNPENVCNKVKILVEKDDNIPSLLYGDYLRLQQILLNLLSNSVKFTEVGEIKIKVNAVKNKADKITLEFKVVDTGIGISEEVARDIFEPFKQADNSIISNHKGTGLGLAISKKIVKLMNGNIGVKSKLNEGSTFFFTVDFDTKPIDDNHHQEKNTEICKENDGYSVDKFLNTRILVVDDNLINQDVLKAILEEVGIIVTLASSGMEAIKKVKTKEFDMVLMDLRMPLMDGYEATKEIRKIKSSKELPIIAVSASVSPDEERKCIASGIHEFVTKPIDKEKLFNSICKSLSSNREFKKHTFTIEKKPIVEEKNINLRDYQIEGIDIEKALNHLNNNEELFLRILKRFKNNHGNVVEEINQALSVEDRELAIRLAHTIKGVSGELTATEVYRLSSELESDIIEGVLDNSELLAELDKKLSKMFESEVFREEEKHDQNKTDDLKELAIEKNKPLLKDLETYLLDSDTDGIKQIEKIEKETKDTFIHTKIKEMKLCGEQYNFEGALSLLDEINHMISEKEDA